MRFYPSAVIIHFELVSDMVGICGLMHLDDCVTLDVGGSGSEWETHVMMILDFVVWVTICRSFE
jgi:hypothetical protein